MCWIYLSMWYFNEFTVSLLNMMFPLQDRFSLLLVFWDGSDLSSAMFNFGVLIAIRVLVGSSLLFWIAFLINWTWLVCQIDLSMRILNSICSFVCGICVLWWYLDDLVMLRWFISVMLFAGLGSSVRCFYLSSQMDQICERCAFSFLILELFLPLGFLVKSSLLLWCLLNYLDLMMVM